jgi:class 3 adenylate cyclase
MGPKTHIFGLKSIRTLLTAGCILLLFATISGQDQPLADSLETIFLNVENKGVLRLALLDRMLKEQTNPEKALYYSEILLAEADSLQSTEFRYKALLHKGNALTLKGDLSEALQTYFLGEEIAADDPRDNKLGKIYIAIAAVYSAMGNKANTIRYYKNAISLLRESTDSALYAAALENLGDEYNINFSKPDSALLFFEASGIIWKAIGHKTGIAYNLGNVGLAYAQKGMNTEAERNISGAIGMLEELGNYYPISVYLTYMSDIYREKGDWDAAFIYALRSLKLARQYGLKEQMADAYLKLSELYESSGYEKAALNYYKSHIAFKDSVKNIASVQQMADMQTRFEVARKQSEVDLLNQQRRTQRIIVIAVIIALFLITLLAIILYRKNRFINATNSIIEREMDKSDALLKNILPESTAQELKANGRVEAKEFASVSVLFTDFSGFTRFSETLTPDELVRTVDFYFSNFDRIIQQYGLEKIKTIGDAYMCAAGLPYPNELHAVQIVAAAIDIVDFVEKVKRNQELPACFDIRVGIHSGPVVAGVVGTRKFAYDIWGDTVNIASRMESASPPGKINISESTYTLIRHAFQCESRGVMEVKNKGVMQMYFVTRPIGSYLKLQS